MSSSEQLLQQLREYNEKKKKSNVRKMIGITTIHEGTVEKPFDVTPKKEVSGKVTSKEKPVEVTSNEKPVEVILPKDSPKKTSNYLTTAIIAFVIIFVQITINYKMGQKIIDVSSLYDVQSLFCSNNVTESIVDHAQMSTPTSNLETIASSLAGLESLRRELKEEKETTQKKIDDLSALFQNVQIRLDSVLVSLDANVSDIGATFDDKVSDLNH